MSLKPIGQTKNVPLVPTFAVVILLGLAGCLSRPTDQQVQQGAAKTTVAVKEGAKQAVVASRVIAADAGRQIKNVAVGVKQGLKEDAPTININRATKVSLATLPGINLEKAGEIVRKRPYTSSRQLVSRGVLTTDQYDRVADRITTGK